MEQQKAKTHRLRDYLLIAIFFFWAILALVEIGNSVIDEIHEKRNLLWKGLNDEANYASGNLRCRPRRHD